MFVFYRDLWTDPKVGSSAWEGKSRDEKRKWVKTCFFLYRLQAELRRLALYSVELNTADM